MKRSRLCAALLTVVLAGCAGPARRPEPQPDFAARVSAFAADTIQGGRFAHLPGGLPDGGVGMTHTAGAVGSPAGAGNASGAATLAVGASAIVVGNVAVVGIDPQIWPAVSPTVLQSVRTRVLSEFPQLAEVRVVNESEQAARVARIQREMQAGIPATARLNEIQAVIDAAR
jgi:hypothetical protein